jgi:dipeptidyl aminopeptidase/acylaminoacyl peptidase
LTILKSIQSICLFAAVFCSFSSSRAQGQEKRQPEFADLFRFETVLDTKISPDGGLVSYTVDRLLGVGREPKSPYEYSMMGTEPRRDVWVIPIGGGTARNITNGSEDGASFWDPQWSPDGQQLMMLSTRGGSVRIWIWSRRTAGLHLLSNLPVCPQVLLGKEHQDREWVSNHEVFFTVPLEDVTWDSFSSLARQGQRKLGAASKSFNELATVSVLDSGIAVDLTTPDTEMVIVDSNTGKEQVLGTTTGASNAGFWKLTAVSPDKRWVAVLREDHAEFLDPNKPLGDDNNGVAPGTFALTVFDRQAIGKARILSDSGDIRVNQWTRIVWSPDSTQLFIDSYDSQEERAQQTPYSCVLSSLSCSILEADPGFSFGKSDTDENIQWVGDHRLLLRETVSARKNPADVDWIWRTVGENGKLSSFGPGSSQLPLALVPINGSSDLAMIKDGALWRIDENGTPTKLVEIRGLEVTDLLFVSKGLAIFNANAKSTSSLYEADLQTGKVTPISAPTPGASLVDYNPGTMMGLFLRWDWSSGTNLWSKNLDSSKSSLLLAKNSYLSEIAPFRKMGIRYRTAEGQEVGGVVWLPTDYIPGKRYPVVVKVYPGNGPLAVPRADQEISEEPIEALSMESEQALAVHGYVVLQPSMPNFLHSTLDNPAERQGKIRDKYLELTKGVLPAIDRLIELGIADPDRIGLMGHSDGGYATYGLITATNRFKAAVAQSGYADALSLYGTFAPQRRYIDGPAPGMSAGMAVFMEMVGGTEGPPWKNLWAYLRNSPIAYVDRVNTPLMIVQGDMDVVPIQQGEEFYTALQRQNKRVEFARYWGEGHIFNSPANLYDLWMRQYAWFDEFLKPGEPAKTEAIH